MPFAGIIPFFVILLLINKMMMMKIGRGLMILVLVLVGLNGMGQNLVPNPSFEIYDTCPNTLGQISKATGWWDSRPDAEYFNVCAPYFPHPINCVAVPLNSAGYRTPASGNGYAGIIAKGGSNEDRECLGGQLITPLQIGIRYYASFKVSLIGQMYQPNRCGINKLGIFFSTVRYDSLSPAPICNNCEQIINDSIIVDSLNWTRIKGTFVADSNYSYITIGRLNFNSLTDSIQLAGTLCFAYYFIDDVVVSTDSSYAYNYVYTGTTEFNKPFSLSISPNPFTLQTTLTLQGIYHNPSLFIYNLLGQEVKSIPIGSNKEITIYRNQLPGGMYFYKLIEENKEVLGIGKLLVE